MAGIGARVRVAAKAAVGIFNENSAREAWGMLSGIFQGGIGNPPVRGTRDFLRAYSQQPWLRAVSSRVADRVASAEWQLFINKKGDAKAQLNRRVQRAMGQDRRKMLKQLADKGELQQLEQHPLLEVLSSANSFQTGRAMRKVTQIHVDLVGEAFWLKERDGMGVVTGVWPLPPDWVLNTPTPTQTFYRVQFKGWRGWIPDTEILWFADTDPSNPYGRGSGTAQALSDELETDEYAAKHAKAFFYNRARPDVIVYPKQGNMRPADVERLEEDWLSKNQGFWKAFKPYFLTREVGVHEMEQNFRSQQLVQVREQERNIVMQTFGVPPEILGVLDNSNRATITAADLVFSRYVIEPRLEFLRAVMQERLVPEYDERLILEFGSPVQDDKDFHLDVAKVAPQVLTTNEWRDMMGLAPLEDDAAGELHAVPTTVHMQPLEEWQPPVPVAPLGPDGKPVPPKPVPGASDAPKPDAPDDAGKRGIVLRDWETLDWRGELRQAGLVCRESGDEDGEAFLLKAAGDDAADLPEASRAAHRMEAELARALVASWDRWEATLDMAALEAAIHRMGHEDEVVAQLRPPTLDAVMQEALQPALLRAFLRGASLGAEPLRRAGVQVRDYGGAVVELAALDIASVNADAIAWSRLHTAELLDAGIRARQRVRRLVREALAAGRSPKDLARELVQVIPLTEAQWGQVTAFRRRLAAQGLDAGTVELRTARYVLALRRARALTIARTELMAAINGGQQAMWERAAERGLIDRRAVKRQWLVCWDELLEAGCEALADVTVGLDEEFEPGLMVPPKHPRCRCSVALSVPPVAQRRDADVAEVRAELEALRAREPHETHVHVAAPVMTVEPTTVTVQPPVVHVAAPEVTVQPPEVHVAAPQVSVHVPPPGNKRVERDAQGRVVRVVQDGE